MTPRLACCPPVATVEAAPTEITQAGVCCGSVTEAAGAGACCDPAAKREAVAAGTGCCA